MEQDKLHTAPDQLHRAWLTVLRAKRHARKGAVVVAVGTVASLAFAVLRERSYVSDTVLLYRQLINPRLLGGGNRDRVRVKDTGVRLGEILRSRPNLQRTIKKFRLYPDLVAQDRGVEAVELMRQSIRYRVRPGDTIHISFTGTTPEQAQQVTAYLAKRLIDEDRRLRSEQATVAGGFINAELKRVRDELDERERDLARFLAENPEFARVMTPGSGTAGAAIRAQGRPAARKLAAGPENAVQALRRQRARILERLGVRSPSHKVTRDPKIVAAQRAAEREVTRERQRLDRLKTQFTDLHPDIQVAKARVGAAEAKLERVTRLLESSSHVDKPVSTADQKALRESLRRIEQKIRAHEGAGARRVRGGRRGGSVKDRTATRIVALELEWSKLNRNVAESRDRYLQLESRQFQTLLSTNVELLARAGNIEIIDPAYRPTRPAGTGRTVVVLGGGTLSVFLALSLMMILAILDNRIYREADFERLNLDIPVLTVIPTAKLPEKKRRRLRG